MRCVWRGQSLGEKRAVRTAPVDGRVPRLRMRLGVQVGVGRLRGRREQQPRQALVVIVGRAQAREPAVEWRDAEGGDALVAAIGAAASR